MDSQTDALAQSKSRLTFLKKFSSRRSVVIDSVMFSREIERLKASGAETN